MSIDVPGYQLERCLGAGSMGQVWLARQRGSGAVAALKLIPTHGDSEVLARARREGQVLATLDHPHIVRIFDLIDEGDRVVIAMQYAPGGSLAQRLASRGRLSATEVVAIAAPLADALSSAHRRGILHRDVKPANVLFTSDGEPLLSDFGVAHWAGSIALTHGTGASVGTAEYLDPAVAEGASPDQRSDIYALGVLCYEALAGVPPYTGATPLAVLWASTGGHHVALVEAASEVPSALAEVIEQAMAQDPARRPVSAAELASAFRAAVGRPERRLEPSASGAGAGVRPFRLGDPWVGANPEVGSAGETLGRSGLTQSFGPRPPSLPRPALPGRGRGPKLKVALVALSLLAGPLMVMELLGDHRSALPKPSFAVRRALPVPAPPAPPSAQDEPKDKDKAEGPATNLARPCPPIAPAPGLLEVQADGRVRVIQGDLDGDGCPEALRWSGNLIEVALEPQSGREHPVRFEVGRPGDRLVLGDWDCDGRDTPGLYRPTSGQVFVFNRWADVGEPVVSLPPFDTGVRHSTPTAADPDGDGCDQIVMGPLGSESE